MVSHSFVLADVFEVESMSLDVPDCVLEADVALGWVTCPDCNGECWVRVEGASPYANAALAWGHLQLADAFKPCLRCKQEGDVLDVLEPLLLEIGDLEPLPITYTAARYGLRAA